MMISDLRQIIAQGEGTRVEFSKCTTELTDAVFQSVCSFLNKEGGILIVGVHDFGKIAGVAPSFVGSMLDKFVYAMEHYFQPVCRLLPEVVDFGGKKLLCIEIPYTDEVYRFKNKFFDRNGAKVVDITYAYNLVENIYLRKMHRSSENIVCHFLQMHEFEESAFNEMRRTIAERQPNHPWLALSNEEFLHEAGFWQRSPVNGKEGFVLAAVLLFGKEVTLQNHCPVTYRNDAVFRDLPFEESCTDSDYSESRYDDRDLIFSNLIETYERLLRFGRLHLPERVLDFPDGKVDIREKIYDEIIGNFLVHRDYASPVPARLLLFKDRLITENGSSSLHGPETTFEQLVPKAKNPLLEKVFRAMGWMDEPGSGKQTLQHYAPFYDRTSKMEIHNGETFSFSISFGKAEGLEASALLPPQAEKVEKKTPVKAPIEWDLYVTPLTKACPQLDISYVDKAESVLEACLRPLPIQPLMQMVHQSNRTRFRQNILHPLIAEGLLAMRIPTKPSSPLQTYFTTPKGKSVLEALFN